jgi:hypothetical protein
MTLLISLDYIIKNMPAVADTADLHTLMIKTITEIVNQLI